MLAQADDDDENDDNDENDENDENDQNNENDETNKNFAIFHLISCSGELALKSTLTAVGS